MERRQRVALLLGSFTNPAESIQKYFALTDNAKIFDMNLKEALTTHLASGGPFEKGVKIKVLRTDDPTTHHYVKDYEMIAVVDLGPLTVPTGLQYANAKIDLIIQGIVYGIRYLKRNKIHKMYIDPCGYPKIVGTAVALALPSSDSNSDFCTKFFGGFYVGGESEYKKGISLGKGQRLAQTLMKSTSVSQFVRITKLFLSDFDVKVIERPESWVKEHRMDSLLSTKGAGETVIILEIVINNSRTDIKPLVVVGKATPFESSLFPLCDKPEFSDFHFRNGMGGASSIVGSVYSLCKLRSPVRVHCILAIVWNNLHEKHSKKGSLIQTMNGTCVHVDGPKAESRLIMADVLCYADTLDSSAIVDVTTLSSNIDSLLGNSYIGFFTSDERLERLIYEASQSSGEKVWKLPLYKSFRSLLKDSVSGRLSNVGVDEKSVTVCKSASFLGEFVRKTKPWIHLDISAVTESRGKKIYLEDWATGRSTRLLTEFCLEYFQKE